MDTVELIPTAAYVLGCQKGQNDPQTELGWTIKLGPSLSWELA